MADHTLFNPGPDALAYDNAGHRVDAQDRVVANPNGQVVKALLERGALVDQGPVEEDPAPVPEQVIVEDDTEQPIRTDESGD